MRKIFLKYFLDYSVFKALKNANENFTFQYKNAGMPQNRHFVI
nr:MAG TPA: hypothetical protein [Caudoviricetes sp.]